jgi:hypothetical protein
MIPACILEMARDGTRHVIPTPAPKIATAFLLPPSSVSVDGAIVQFPTIFWDARMNERTRMKGSRYLLNEKGGDENTTGGLSGDLYMWRCE